MRFAFSSDDSQGLESNVSQHFGRCPYFVLVDFEDETVKEVNVVDNPYFEGHGPGQVPEYIASLGTNVMISGGMGRRANVFFDNYGIKTAAGAIGTVQEALSSFHGG
ncbi:MAG: NifB/NifX family molybdenum-iron cluster-binding protein [Anaerolineales bacterium]